MPRGPTSQQTDGDGDDPAASVSLTPVCCVCHVEPPSDVRCTAPPFTILHRLAGFDDTITGMAAPRNACASVLNGACAARADVDSATVGVWLTDGREGAAVFASVLVSPAAGAPAMTGGVMGGAGTAASAFAWLADGPSGLCAAAEDWRVPVTCGTAARSAFRSAEAEADSAADEDADEGVAAGALADAEAGGPVASATSAG